MNESLYIALTIAGVAGIIVIVALFAFALGLKAGGNYPIFPSTNQTPQSPKVGEGEWK
jgi:hypothetical protein